MIKLRKQSKELIFCDDCGQEITNNEVFCVEQKLWKEGAIGFIRSVRKEICWKCMQLYINLIKWSDNCG